MSTRFSHSSAKQEVSHRKAVTSPSCWTSALWCVSLPLPPGINYTNWFFFIPGAFIFYARYKQVQLHLDFDESQRKGVRVLNVVCLVLGEMMALGTSMIGSFELSCSFHMHVFSANITFIVGTLYCILQVFFLLFISINRCWHLSGFL